MKQWNPDGSYQPGDLVLWQHKLYLKRPGDSNTEPGVGNDWTEQEVDTTDGGCTVKQFEQIQQTITTYAARKQAAATATFAALAREGLNPAKVKAILDGQDFE